MCVCMQVRAIMEGACNAMAAGHDVQPDIMVPLVGSVAELQHQAALVRETADAVLAARDMRVSYRVGTMIETPRAALTAGAIANAVWHATGKRITHYPVRIEDLIQASA